MIIPFTQFPEDEIEDFKTICKETGYNPNDFLIKANSGTHIPNVWSEKLEIQIFHTPSTKAISLNGGHVSSWTLDFEKTVKSGFFN
jgi:hypothetical protein